MRKVLVIALAFLIAGTAAGAFAQAPAEKAPAGSYVGPAKCKMCHSSDAKGAQYKVWAASPHAKAFEVLGTPAAAEVAKKAGITAKPQEAPECLACHTTGAAAKAELRAKIKPEDGVSCEACHGAGSGYVAMADMKAVWDGTKKPADVGLVLPDEAVCKTCHNEKSPTYKPFEFAKMVAKIKHPYPADKAKPAAAKS